MKIRMPLMLILFLLAVAITPTGWADSPAQESGEQVLQKYLSASHDNQDKLRGMAMEVDIEARLPRLKKTGKLHALRYVTKLGSITYRILNFQGDNTVKKDVIARYLQAEKEAGEKSDLGVTPDNYRFEYRGLVNSGSWRLHLFHLSPKKKTVGLFAGWLWINAETGLPVREQGELVKSPSVFLRKVAFTRDYENRDGVAVPVRIDSSIDTRIVGTAEVEIRYTNIKKQPPEQSSSTTARAFATGQ